ncbi:hypothetical protein BDB00DRAFT_805055 [Zychaea mexicana]|uniref:uncharacterized protein n=1 Tax=Zychaea mexicana TaxID=64656 RepID=UPI0022FE1991|nr:uncharacterized protein BDB00DRAFT_805055 [Zychaea mexicana]KAI9497550.1 hypothetical protein BDB00DRAFT_805055 [Zychaea mexicana]
MLQLFLLLMFLLLLLLLLLPSLLPLSEVLVFILLSAGSGVAIDLVGSGLGRESVVGVLLLAVAIKDTVAVLGAATIGAGAIACVVADDGLISRFLRPRFLFGRGDMEVLSCC